MDELIPHRYDIKSLDLKVENKKALLAKMGLPVRRATPSSGSSPAWRTRRGST